MKNFRINEFVCRCGCEMPAEARQNIEALVANVLDPVRDEYGKPIYVNSGYRCAKHNAAVGGVPKSQHMLGQAADISVKSEPTPEREESQACLSYPEREGGRRSQKLKVKSELEMLASIIVSQGRFDQLILYPTFLHVSYKRSGVNRHKVLRKTATSYEVLRCLDA